MINTIYSINAKPFLGEENRYHYLYMITNKVNGKIYKGTTAGDKNAMAKPVYKIDTHINIMKEFGSRKSAMSTVDFKLNQMIKALKNFSVAPDGYYYIYKEDYDKFISA